MISILINGEYFSEEAVYILFCILNGLNPDLKTEFLPLSFQFRQSLHFLLLPSPLLFPSPLLYDLLKFLPLLIFDHTIQLYLFVLRILFHLLD